MYLHIHIHTYIYYIYLQYIQEGDDIEEAQ